MIHSLMVLAYLGPETMLPMTSVVAGVAGIVMLFGRNAFRVASGMVRKLGAMARPRPTPTTPSRKIGSGRVGASKKERVKV